MQAVVGDGACSDLGGIGYRLQHLVEGAGQTLACVNISLGRTLNNVMSGLKCDVPSPGNFGFFLCCNLLKLVKRRIARWYFNGIALVVFF